MDTPEYPEYICLNHLGPWPCKHDDGNRCQPGYTTTIPRDEINPGGTRDGQIPEPPQTTETDYYPGQNETNRINTPPATNTGTHDARNTPQQSDVVAVALQCRDAADRAERQWAAGPAISAAFAIETLRDVANRLDPPVAPVGPDVVPDYDRCSDGEAHADDDDDGDGLGALRAMADAINATHPLGGKAVRREPFRMIADDAIPKGSAVIINADSAFGELRDAGPSGLESVVRRSIAHAAAAKKQSDVIGYTALQRWNKKGVHDLADKRGWDVCPVTILDSRATAEGYAESYADLHGHEDVAVVELRVIKLIPRRESNETGD